MIDLKVPITQPTIDEILDNLAALLPHEYESRRLESAKRLKFRPVELDKEVTRRRKFLLGETDENTLSGSELIILDPEPWNETVDDVGLLDELSGTFRRFVHFQRASDADTIALFCVATHCIDQFSILPYLGITAPSKECGKTTAMEIAAQFVARALTTSDISGAGIYRVIELFRPTICVDEMDAINDDENKHLLKIFNAGHKRCGAWVIRCDGENSTPRMFNCFGPKIYGMIGRPPATMLSRSIIVNLLRKDPNERLEKFDLQRTSAETKDAFARLRRQCKRWALDHIEQLTTHIPNTQGIGNRSEDNWVPLLIIAELAGGDWPERARAAANLPPLHQRQTDQDILLQDLSNIFFTRKLTKIPSVILVKDLLRQRECTGRWHRFHKDKDPNLDAEDLADLLGQFEIHPKRHWLNEDDQGQLYKEKPEDRKQIRGYSLEDLEPLFTRFLVGKEPEVVDVTQPEPF